MKKLRVFQAFKTSGNRSGRLPLCFIKRIVPGGFPGNPGTVLLFLVLLPYLITFMFGNLREGYIQGEERIYSVLGEGNLLVFNTTALGTEHIPLELYVADKLERSIDNGYEMETLKAQAVLIRSGLLASFDLADGELPRSGEIRAADANYGTKPASESVLAAVSETKGICLMWNGRPVNGAYFMVSNGATRNGDEVFPQEYPYLKSALCSRDFLSPDYASSAGFGIEEFDRIWSQLPAAGITEEKILENGNISVEKELDNISLYRDSVGYVLFLERDGKFVSGEQFREGYHLASAGFHLSREEREVVITVKGAGHGFGMSQFGANEMAKEGEDYVAILNYFFDDVTFTKFE